MCRHFHIHIDFHHFVSALSVVTDIRLFLLHEIVLNTFPVTLYQFNALFLDDEKDCQDIKVKEIFVADRKDKDFLMLSMNISCRCIITPRFDGVQQWLLSGVRLLLVIPPAIPCIPCKHPGTLFCSVDRRVLIVLQSQSYLLH